MPLMSAVAFIPGLSQVYLADSSPTPSGLWSSSQSRVSQDRRNRSNLGEVRRDFPQVSNVEKRYSWATLSSRRRRTLNRTWLDGAISRDLSRIFRVATRNPWSGKLGAPKDSAVLDKSSATIASTWSISSHAQPLLEYQVQRFNSGHWNQYPAILIGIAGSPLGNFEWELSSPF